VKESAKQVAELILEGTYPIFLCSASHAVACIGRVRVPAERPTLEHFIAARGTKDAITHDVADCGLVVNANQYPLGISVERHDLELL
jgi:hypothetical protein